MFTVNVSKISHYFSPLSPLGGVMCAAVLLTLLWLIVACCVSCGNPPVDVDYVYVSPEKKKYDDWIVNDRQNAGY